ncbi:hypothetical protein FN846DRAFT_941611 [Sphaerosporella brunnea]|uniref:Protein BTN n=1 Tax=Sphaerosporella brunnea TaxID=1250544 RepID=A0A5J5F2I5_9PEZI|nr:hypothetical protein FN846DRAFT_941611 [Sphaerosporella brunnea]
MSSKDVEMRATKKVRLGMGFLLIETAVAIQYSLIVTAANDLVAEKAPTGLVLFAYSIPSILTRIIVPLVQFPDTPTNSRFIGFFNRWSRVKVQDPNSLTREVNYTFRLAVCALSSFIGLMLLAGFENIGIRVLGVMLAALSSNLGDMSMQMLCARYPHGHKYAFGGYTAGSGAAAMLGAWFYTFATSTLQHTPGWAITAIGIIAPPSCLLCYAWVLPSPEVETLSATEKEKEGIVQLPWRDKLCIIKPMFVPYMLPLATIFFVENLVTQGIFPTLLFYLPLKEGSFYFSNVISWMGIFKESREFYPFYLTVSQFAGFAGKFSFWLFRLPGGKRRSTKAYWLLNILEGVVFLLQAGNSLSMTSNVASSPEAPDKGVLYGPMGVIFLSGLQGLMAGIVFCNTYWKVMHHDLPPAVFEALDKAREKNGHLDRPYRDSLESREEGLGLLENPAEGGIEEYRRSTSEDKALKEFLLSTIAPPDVMSVTIASVFGMALQKGLCEYQLAHGRDLCLKPAN